MACGPARGRTPPVCPDPLGVFAFVKQRDNVPWREQSPPLSWWGRDRGEAEKKFCEKTRDSVAIYDKLCYTHEIKGKEGEHSGEKAGSDRGKLSPEPPMSLGFGLPGGGAVSRGLSRSHGGP